MGNFYKPSSYRKWLKFFHKHGFSIRQGGEHLIATYPEDESIELSIPRSTSISNGLTNEACKKLVELGFDEKDIRKVLK